MLKVKLLSYTPNPEEVIASAAKLCYSPVGVDEIMEKQDGESIEKFVKKLNSINHLSPFEHASFTFAIEGVSRALTHQLVRHRIASYSQQSQRYVKESKFEYITPKSIEGNPRALATFNAQMDLAQAAYDELVIELILDKIFSHKFYTDWYGKIADGEIGSDAEKLAKVYENINNDDYECKLKYIEVFKEYYGKEYATMEKEAIEDARYVFPNATETKIVVTMNARTLLHFFQLRSCNRAQQEIRDLSDEMLKLVYEVAPAIFYNAGPTCVKGKCSEGNMSCGMLRKFEDII